MHAHWDAGEDGLQDAVMSTMHQGPPNCLEDESSEGRKGRESSSATNRMINDGLLRNPLGDDHILVCRDLRLDVWGESPC